MTLQAIEDFISKQKTAFIGSMDAEGFPNIKAMFAPRRMEAGGIYYFSTNKSSLRTGQYLENPKASVYFYQRGRFKYTGIMLVGTMEVLEDHDSKASIWQPGDTMYYPAGIDDPDYCVLKFTTIRGRYYQSLTKGDFTF